MPTYTFAQVTLPAEKTGKCPACGKSVKRSTSFSQTLNPFNKNKETGAAKTRPEIMAELKVEAAAWKAKPVMHAKCENS